MDYFDLFDEVVTMESSFIYPFISSKDLIIPYINLAVSNHPLNLSSDLKYLNYCYIICQNVVQVKFNSDLIYENDGINFNRYSFVYIGGSEFIIGKESVEFCVLCENKFLRTLDYTSVESAKWNIEELEKDVLDNFIKSNIYSNKQLLRRNS